MRREKRGLEVKEYLQENTKDKEMYRPSPR
jgi:hypothetical protein